MINRIVNNPYKLQAAVLGLYLGVNEQYHQGTLEDYPIMHSLAQAWEEEDWFATVNYTTIEKHRDFLEYEWKTYLRQVQAIAMVTEQEDLSFGVSLNTNHEDYTQLRKGLATYSEDYIKDEFKAQIKDIGRCSMSVLDIGGGNGQYCDYIREVYPTSYCTVLDKVWPAHESEYAHARLKVDFMADPSWDKKHNGQYDIIMLNEILHCKDFTAQNRLMRSAERLLKPSGHVIVVDQVYTHRFNMRMSQLSKGGCIFQIGNLRKLYSPESFNERKVVNISDSHWMAILQEKHRVS